MSGFDLGSFAGGWARCGPDAHSLLEIIAASGERTGPRELGPDEPILELESDLPRSLAVGGGTCLFVRGVCRGLDGSVQTLDVVAGDDGRRARAHWQPAARSGGVGEFWTWIPVPALQRPRIESLDVELRRGSRPIVRRRLGAVELVPSLPRPHVEAPAPRRGAGNGRPLVAICMATFEPPPYLLRRQIDSIREQTHDNWICLISDDSSSPGRLADLESIVGRDSRFVVSRSSERLGFYRNFERALAMVPPEADFVALADQDDYWYPEKLGALLVTIPGANLAYSDMRIVDEQGHEVSPTYWAGRRNNHTNLASLLLANTVTGSASLFSRDLLDLALPFPPPVGDAFHDQWIALVALASGRIAYVDRALYDYVQHSSASLGHDAAIRAYDPRRRIFWKYPLATAQGIVDHGRRSYFANLCRIALIARTLLVRHVVAGNGPRRRAIERAARLGTNREPVGWLALRSLRRLVGRNETMGIELSLITAIAWRHLTALHNARRSRS